MNVTISDELKDFLLAELRRYREQMLNLPKADKKSTTLIIIPMVLDGVIDYLVYNTQLKRYTELRVKIAILDDGISAAYGGKWYKTPVHCDNYETVSIPIPQDFMVME
jgi:hypothetical protein